LRCRISTLGGEDRFHPVPNLFQVITTEYAEYTEALEIPKDEFLNDEKMEIWDAEIGRETTR
jgi:hypothetical protein